MNAHQFRPNNHELKKMHLTCLYTVNRSLDLYLQIAKGALLTLIPGASSEHLDIGLGHRFCVWSREYLFGPNGYAVHVLGGDQTLADLYPGPFSSNGKVVEVFAEGGLSIQGG